ncbi:MAG: manganese efflux pump [Clostridia bacterium]|nr:manganese efflux pump [Clostridia bacterium]
MSLFELIITAIALAMDAFAVSICKGLSLQKVSLRSCLTVGLWFGFFQGLMPLLGCFLGFALEKYITSIDHIISFALLSIIGFNMIKGALSSESTRSNGSLSVLTMFPLAVATSIDALTVGITFGILPQVNIYAAVLLIGFITLVLSTLGVWLGSAFGAKYKSLAEVIGGIILILIGLKILLEHMGILL